MKTKVCFVCVYFGEIPAFFKTFLDSCRWNRDFNWLLVHDREYVYDAPCNVKFLKMTIQDFLSRVNKITGLNITKIKPYKICDFRPAYGEIFSEELFGYDFWGICDTDMLLGTLSDYVTDNLLKRYDKIFTMGHMSIVRNNRICNSAYKRETKHSRNYQEVFKNPLNCIYDEYEGFTEKFEDLGLNVYKEKVCADIYTVGRRINITTKKRFQIIQPGNTHAQYCEARNFSHQLFVLDKGRVLKLYVRDGEVLLKEYSYIHKLELAYAEKISADDFLIITRAGFVKDNAFRDKYNKSELENADLDRYNPPDRLKEMLNNIYLWIRLGLRNIRKEYFPKENEI